MTLDERIEKHQRTIEAIQEDIEWLRSSSFTINSGTKLDGDNNANLIERQEENIRMYNGFIADLKKRGA